ncbi:type VI secretion system lipoprotein TssJ [Methylomarinum sp. Ch1-1]|uniref:Type VI secretion system lipoprotein TssJ n=1 Tax=Methylomarinum roseum TaxID=3067653 RepID=A0AAU7NSF0_9GAMM|nr:type VI secretion system lipoprotein TssJ [Methylomarinum sp. Ch1-1]MDP4520076.1 type VI secretion system lipoprotein TssJ [Methylomarinum sp. Ch1-1]
MTRKYLSKYLLTGLHLVLLSLLTACSTSGDVEREAIFANLTVIADANLNPAIDGRASPIVTRVYQLAETAKFDNSGFFALYENDQALLGNDLLSRIELEVKPDENYQHRLEIKPNTRFIAVLAAFRDLDNSQWKDMTAFQIDSNRSLTIKLNENSVKLTVNSADQ